MARTNTLPRNVMRLFREDLESGDPWGSAMSYLFPLAEILRRAGECPEDYGPALGELLSERPAEYGEDRVTTDLWDGYIGTPGVFVPGFTITLEDLRYAYAVLRRYADLCESEGQAY